VLGDTHCDAPEVRKLFEGAEHLLGSLRHGPYPRADAGVDVRRILHYLRSMVFFALKAFVGSAKLQERT
jgi:hypothetical protein